MQLALRAPLVTRLACCDEKLWLARVRGGLHRLRRVRKGSRRGVVRGFTLLELMAVICIIGILAAIASPAFVQVMRDQRVSRCAMELADQIRFARGRALGRGSAVLVRWTGTGGVTGQGLIEVREAITAPPAGGGAVLPLPTTTTSCLGTDWTNGSTTSRAVQSFDPGAGNEYELAQIALMDPNATQQNYYELCFTPLGRSYFRTAAAGGFNLLTGVPSFIVTNTRTLRPRTVFIPPNGAARVML